MVTFASAPLPAVQSEADFARFVRQLDGELDAISQTRVRFGWAKI